MIEQLRTEDKSELLLSFLVAFALIEFYEILYFFGDLNLFIQRPKIFKKKRHEPDLDK